MKKNKTLIPKGYYCYTKLEMTKNGRYKIMGVCPYWSKKAKRPKQENGYCAYLGKGDYEINRESTIIIQTTWNKETGKKIKTKIKCGPENPSFMSLLWDMCKMCNIKECD